MSCSFRYCDGSCVKNRTITKKRRKTSRLPKAKKCIVREANSELEAQAAAMREALDAAKRITSLYEVAHKIELALSTDAGRRVQDVVEAARHFMCEDMASHVADANSQPLSEAWNKLNEALAAMGK